MGGRLRLSSFAKPQYVYSILRGQDLETGEFSRKRRESQFDVLKEAQARILDLTSWYAYFDCLRVGGFLGGRLIASNNNLLFACAFYLIGRNEHPVPPKQLRRVIARWFSMCSLTGRYAGPPESNLEFDLARLRHAHTVKEFVELLDALCDAALTNDFWAINLPTDLATSSPRSLSLLTCYAALAVAGAKALFSDQEIEALLDLSVHSIRSAADRHHLFPKAILKTVGITSIRDTNQIANYALVEWGDNGELGAGSPEDYVPLMAERLRPSELAPQYQLHALPDAWESMQYKQFLAERRERIG
ncbi:MAG: hypothetical protein IPM29_27390 [Planctomycetes bacterium]|nr:hypothetical protein [Planctomycetota bacterium]